MLIAERAMFVARVLQRLVGKHKQFIDQGDFVLAGFDVAFVLKIVLAVGHESVTKVDELTRRQQVNQGLMGHGDIHSRRSGSAHEIWPTKEAMQTGAGITRYI